MDGIEVKKCLGGGGRGSASCGVGVCATWGTGDAGEAVANTIVMGVSCLDVGKKVSFGCLCGWTKEGNECTVCETEVLEDSCVDDGREESGEGEMINWCVLGEWNVVRSGRDEADLMGFGGGDGDGGR